MRVLITGAGIAGNALAFWLVRQGHQVTVIERFPRLRTSGLQVDLRGHGIDVIRRMGLEKAIRAKTVAEQGVQVVDSSGRRWGYFPVNTDKLRDDEDPKKRPQAFTTEFEIMRGDLCRVFYDAASDGAEYVFDTSVESFTDRGADVEVCFANGSKGCFDLVVGADGQNSGMRRMMFDPAVAEAAYHPFKGVYMAYCTIPRPIKKGEEYVATVYIAPGKRGFMTRRHNPDQIQVYAGCTTKSELLRDAVSGGQRSGDQVAAWADVFKGAGWQTEELFSAIKAKDKDQADFYTERPALVKLKSWSQGRITLLGDAAWCPTVTTGMGTTSAIVGAYVLAGEIGKHCAAGPDGLEAALEAYQRKFAPFMDQVQRRLSTDNSGTFGKLPSSALGITMLLSVTWLVSALKVNVGRWMLREEVAGWSLPEYGGMR